MGLLGLSADEECFHVTIFKEPPETSPSGVSEPEHFVYSATKSLSSLPSEVAEVMQALHESQIKSKAKKLKFNP